MNFHDGATQPALRTETNPTPVASFTGGYFRQFNGAASLDGRKLAYWYFTTDQRAPAELRTLDVTSPAQQRTVLTLRTEFPEMILWSSDGNGLLYTVTDTNSGQGVVAEYSALRSVDLVTGATRELGRTGPRHWLIGTAWDRERGIVLGYEVEGDSGLLVARYRFGAGSPERMSVPNGVTSMSPSPDGRRMIGLIPAPDGTSTSARLWPLDDPSRYSAFPEDPAWPKIWGWAFRPGTDDVVIWRMNAGGELRSVLWQPSSGQQTPLSLSVTGNFRPDGSAIVSTDGLVYEIATGRTARIDVPPGSFISTLVRFR